MILFSYFLFFFFFFFLSPFFLARVNFLENFLMFFFLLCFASLVVLFLAVFCHSLCKLLSYFLKNFRMMLLFFSSVCCIVLASCEILSELCSTSGVCFYILCPHFFQTSVLLPPLRCFRQEFNVRV